MKTCSKCKVEKDEAEFSKDKNKKDGLNIYCKACWREYRERDAYKESQKAYEQTAARKADRRTDARKAYQKAYQQTDTYKALQKAYYLQRKAAASASNAVPFSDTSAADGVAGMKTCSKCKTEKDEAEFTKDKSKKDGLCSSCKSCVREYQQTDSHKEYWKEHQHTDAYKEYKRAYYLRRKAAAAGNAGQSSDK